MKRRSILNRTILMLLFIGMITGVGLMGCTSEQSGDSLASAEKGELSIGLTDAQGDFATYTVDVLSLTLTKGDGAVVEAVPVSTRVDFSQYTEVTEFVTAAMIPAGTYTRATITLDYRQADIRVENGSGDAVQATVIQDEDGNTITTLQASVQLENTKALVIVPGIPAHLTLDFDLKASNHVNLDDPGAPVVTVAPTLQASVNLEDSKMQRVRGPLKSVDTSTGSFRVILRPFYHALTGNHERFGTLNVITDESTVYDIDGLPYTGVAGLKALEDLGELTAVVAIGELKFNPYRFEAREVQAGFSVPGGTMDAVIGNVIRRSADTLTLKGATLHRNDGSVIFNDHVSVRIDNDTEVSRQLSSEVFSIQDVSVGQRVAVFGALTSDQVDDLQLDATQGYVKMWLTTIRGTVLETAPGDEVVPLVMKLQSIDNRLVSDFDFTGTGVDEKHDADYRRYEVNTGSLGLGDLATNTTIKVRGFVNRFGEAPPDFNAWSIINVADVRAFMKVKWHPPQNQAFASIDGEKLVLNLEQASLFHHVGRGCVVVDLNSLGTSPTIQPADSDDGLFLITWRGTIQTFSDFTAFSKTLQEHLGDSSRTVNSLFASGDFEDDTATLTTDFVDVKLR